MSKENAPTPSPFPDKKPAMDLEAAQIELIRLQQQIEEAKAVQTEARWVVPMDIPNYPIAIYYMTDVHYGAKDMDLSLIDKHLELVFETPNMFLILGGDSIHNMTSKRMPEEDLVPPKTQARIFFNKIKRLDVEKKLGAIVLGEHDGWSNDVESHLSEISAPIFPPEGGLLKIDLEQTVYEIGVVHRHSGRNKDNITSAGKEALRELFPSRDGVLIGHDHRVSGEIYHSEANRRHFVLQGGTYRKGVKLGSKTPTGIALMLWPNEKYFSILPIEAAAFWLEEAAERVKKD